MTDERLLTVREAAERIRASRESIRRWIRQGRLHGTRPGGTKLGYRIRQSEVDRFLAGDQETAGVSAPSAPSAPGPVNQ